MWNVFVATLTFDTSILAIKIYNGQFLGTFTASQCVLVSNIAVLSFVFFLHPGEVIACRVC